ncbi:MAG: ParA family protein [Paracoccaceae bacterium]
MSDIPPPAGRHIISVANQKGGVGKTTTAINLGTALSAVGRKTLIIDLDPQGNASTGLGISPKSRELTTYDLLSGDVGLAEIIHPTSIPALFVAPSTVDMSSADIDLVNDPRRVLRLRDALDRPGARECGFDYILIDCPPSLSLLTVNALVASTSVLVPLQCEFFALEGLSQLMLSIREVRQTLNPQLRIQGIVLTMFDKRNNLSFQVAQDVRENLGDLVYETTIPRNVRLSEAPSHAIPALIYDHRSSGSVAYQKLAAELLRRVRDSVAA